MAAAAVAGLALVGCGAPPGAVVGAPPLEGCRFVPLAGAALARASAAPFFVALESGVAVAETPAVASGVAAFADDDGALVLHVALDPEAHASPLAHAEAGADTGAAGPPRHELRRGADGGLLAAVAREGARCHSAPVRGTAPALRAFTLLTADEARTARGPRLEQRGGLEAAGALRLGTPLERVGRVEAFAWEGGVGDVVDGRRVRVSTPADEAPRVVFTGEGVQRRPVARGGRVVWLDAVDGASTVRAYAPAHPERGVEAWSDGRSERLELALSPGRVVWTERSGPGAPARVRWAALPPVDAAAHAPGAPIDGPALPDGVRATGPLHTFGALAVTTVALDGEPALFVAPLDGAPACVRRARAGQRLGEVLAVGALHVLVTERPREAPPTRVARVVRYDVATLCE